jgi:hypothetical protein
MNTTPPNTAIVVLLLLIAVLAVVAWLMRRQRSLRLKRPFGPEYDLTVSEFHSRSEAETELLNARSASIEDRTASTGVGARA